MVSVKMVYAAANADAEFAGRTFEALSSSERLRYLERAKLMIDAALSKQEPVAWVFKTDLEEGDGSFGSTKGEVCKDRYGDWVNVDTPLYAGSQTKDAE